MIDTTVQAAFLKYKSSFGIAELPCSAKYTAQALSIEVSDFGCFRARVVLQYSAGKFTFIYQDVGLNSI